MDENELVDKEYEHVNMIALYILSKLARSQSMSLLAPGFKNTKACRAMLVKRFPALPHAETPLESLPYITRQTISYALSLVISSVCFHISDIMTKGRPEKQYERLCADLAQLSDEDFNGLIEELMIDYVSKVAGIELAAAATTDNTSEDRAAIRTTPVPGASATTPDKAAPTAAPTAAPAFGGGGGGGPGAAAAKSDTAAPTTAPAPAAPASTAAFGGGGGGAVARRQPSASVAAAPSGGGADNASANNNAASAATNAAADGGQGDVDDGDGDGGDGEAASEEGGSPDKSQSPGRPRTREHKEKKAPAGGKKAKK